ncbi:MAG TPA: hypothetical protein VFU55_00925 [Terracidiphilus sp.]|nr:hypothetical protein [Terracidiphilus sp.]
MSKTKPSSTIGELFVAILMASVASALMAIVGFVGGAILPGIFFTGEATESGLIFAPAFALILGLATFVLVFLWVKNYGNPKT